MKQSTFARPEAQEDIGAGVRWYADREAGLGLRFLREVRTSLERIADNPLMFPVIEEDVRRALLNKFPYSIYFVNIAAPTHGSAAQKCGSRTCRASAAPKAEGLAAPTMIRRLA